MICDYGDTFANKGGILLEVELIFKGSSLGELVRK